jgi:hypothetical protein
MNPRDMLFILVSRFLLSSSSHTVEPFSAHCGQVTGVMNRSRLTTEGSFPMFVRMLTAVQPYRC